MCDFVVFHTLPNVERELKSSFSSDINLETDSNLGHKLRPIWIRCVSFTCMSVHSAAARWVINFFGLSRVTVQWRQILLGSYLPMHFKQSWLWKNQRGEYKTVLTVSQIKMWRTEAVTYKRRSDIFCLRFEFLTQESLGHVWLRYIAKVRQHHHFIDWNGLLAFFSILSAHIEPRLIGENCACWLIFTVEKKVGRLEWKRTLHGTQFLSDRNKIGLINDAIILFWQTDNRATWSSIEA